MIKIPLLLYHDIKPNSFDISCAKRELVPYILKEAQFLKQMKWLYENGYKVIGLKELAGELDHKTVCVVFDDGWLSNYKFAYPVLNKYGFKATFFVTVEYMWDGRMLNWEQIKQLHLSGMTIGSHNLTHRIPRELGEKELNYELSKSKEMIEEKLKDRIDFFSSPTGFFDPRIERLAKQNGYKGACFSKVAHNDLKSDEEGFLRLNKIAIKRSYSLEKFKGIIRGKKRTLGSLRAKQIGRDLAKSLLGPRRYNRMKVAVQRMVI